VLAALDQRILVRYALAGMTATETAGYITHDAASAVMRRGHLNGPAGKCISTGTSRIISRV
jgi:type II secretory pathway predicted ATPase ExeA